MKTLLLVHGLNATCATAFPNMIEAFRSDMSLTDWELLLYDYESLKSIRENGEGLRSLLRALRESNDDRIVVVAHSMGGLISRYACLEKDERSSVDRLIMLATPNFGALRSSQLGLINQVFAEQSRRFGYFLRKPGIADLTNVSEIFTAAFKEGYGRTRTEYVTIPGLYYNKYRSDAQVDLVSFRNWQNVFGLLNLLSVLCETFPRLVRFNLEKPHDGIVEESSVSLVSSEAGRWSEKENSIAREFVGERSYIHVHHRAADDLTHIPITNDKMIIELVRISFWHLRFLLGSLAFLLVRQTCGWRFLDRARFFTPLLVQQERGCSMDRRTFISLASGAVAVPFSMTFSAPRILVIGDSVMWGQGLLENEKIHRLLARMLFNQYGVEPSVLHYAHSGATIGYGNGVGPSPSAPDWWPGEIPISAPTLRDQCNQVAAAHPDQRFDIVLLTGGINDINVQSIFSPFTSLQKINHLSLTYCNQAMTSLLGELRSRYVAANPNVKIIVLGYYSVLSNESNIPNIFDVIRVLAEETISPPRPRIAAQVEAFSAITLDPRRKLIENSEKFREASRNDLTAAVQAANSSSATTNFFFVDPEISDNEAAFAPEALIWGLNRDEKPEDPVYDERIVYCGNLLRKWPGLDRFTCNRASLGHPNVPGAQRYAQKIFAFLTAPAPSATPSTAPSPVPTPTP